MDGSTGDHGDNTLLYRSTSVHIDDPVTGASLGNQDSTMNASSPQASMLQLNLNPSVGIMTIQDLQHLDLLARQLYESVDTKSRAEAEAALLPLAQSPANMVQCMWLLQNSQHSTTLMFAASTLTKIFTQYSNRIGVQDKIQLYSFVIKFLLDKSPSLVSFVLSELCSLVCRIAKLGWHEDDRFRSILDDIRPFFESSEDYYLVGLQLLSRLVAEMNQSSIAIRKTFTQAQHRKVATSFRDNVLQNIYTMALNTLSKLASTQTHSRLRQNALDLASICLNFDFIGTSFDESTEDLGTIQVPVSWRDIIQDPATPKLFFDTYILVYHHDTRQSSQALECLVQLASVRRSLFASDAKRNQYLDLHLDYMLEILRNRYGLDEHDNYHRFCRWLARLKANYQLAELVASTKYPEWITLVSQFTLQSLASDWHWVGNSLFYLLSLWSRLVASMPYLKGNNLSHLEDHVMNIVEAYVSSRLHALHNNSADLDDEVEDMADHFEAIPGLFRLQYEKTRTFLLALIDPLLQQYVAYVVERGITGETSPEVLAIERDLAWLVKVTGAAVGGRLGASSTDAQEAIDGELSARVFQLMIYTIDVDAKIRQAKGNAPRVIPVGMEKLDEAIIDFTQAFRRAYIGEQAVANSKVYVRMGEQLGTADHMVVLNVVASKIACNLRNYGILSGETVVSKSLALLTDLACGHSSGRLLGKLSTIREMLGNHDEAHFPFMKGPDSKMGRQRTAFYQTLARIMFAGFGGGDFDVDSAFDVFMNPLKVRLDTIAQLRTEQFLQDPSVKAAVIGVARDLRGVCSATQLRKTYTMFFDWLHPQYTPVLCRIMEIYSAASASDVTIPLLKFFAELVHNRPQRIIFDSSSPNGILLFRETSKILMAYGKHVLTAWQQRRGSVTDPYRFLFKGAGVCCTIFSRALAGNYVNFGVFALYGDSAFNDALEVCFRLALAIPVNELMAYQKVTKAYFGMIEILCSNHTGNVVALEHSVFRHVITTLQEGLTSAEVWMSTQCASSLDHLAEYRFVHTKKDTPAGKQFLGHVEQSPDMFPRTLEILFNMILNEDCANQWSLSRPLLSMILTNEASFLELKQRIIASQPIQQQQLAAQDAFEKLMSEVQPNLESKNRDRFTQNVTVFRHALRANS